MAIATCDNCEKQWVLRKEPGEYATASGLPDCSDCGSTKVSLVGDGSPETEQSQPEAVQPVAAEGPEEAQMQTQTSAMNGMMSDVGAQMATPAPTPEDKAQKQSELIDVAVSTATGFLKQKAQNKLEGIRRSKEQSRELEAVEEYSTCPECEGAIKNLPPEGHEFDCPHCQTPLRA